ncbi:unnamed protein product [Brassica oleracea]
MNGDDDEEDSKTKKKVLQVIANTNQEIGKHSIFGSSKQDYNQANSSGMTYQQLKLNSPFQAEQQMEANFSGTSSTPRQNQKIDVGGRQSDYEAATKLFGTTNIISMMKLASHEQNHLLASSILKEGAAWTDDNIRGGYGVIQKLMWEIKLHEAYLSEIKKKISEEKKQIVLLLNQYI